MMKLRVSPADALKVLSRIRHKTFRGALASRWTVSDDWLVEETSSFWLFCWCKTGMNSVTAKNEAIQAWDMIMPISFRAYEPTVNHNEARKKRYQ